METNKFIDDDQHVWTLLVLAFVLAGIAWLGCGWWSDRVSDTPQEAANRASANFNQTVADMAAGKDPKTDPKANTTSPAPPWPARHGPLTAGIVFLAVLVIGRLYIFMVRLERRM